MAIGAGVGVDAGGGVEVAFCICGPAAGAAAPPHATSRTVSITIEPNTTGLKDILFIILIS